MTVRRQLLRPPPNPIMKGQAHVVYPPLVLPFPIDGYDFIFGQPEGLGGVEEVSGGQEGP